MLAGGLARRASVMQPVIERRSPPPVQDARLNPTVLTFAPRSCAPPPRASSERLHGRHRNCTARLPLRRELRLALLLAAELSRRHSKELHAHICRLQGAMNPSGEHPIGPEARGSRRARGGDVLELFCR